ncbi:hypothetical protein MRX96_006622 [Rhipicephalus microplus]
MRPGAFKMYISSSRAKGHKKRTRHGTPVSGTKRLAQKEFRTSSGVSRNVRKIVSHPVTEGSDGNSDEEKKAARDYAEKKWVQINISYRLLPLTAVQ